MITGLHAVVVSNGLTVATPTEQVADGSARVVVVVQVIPGPVPLCGMLIGQDAVGTKSVTSDTVQVVWTWLASNVGAPTVQGADGVGPWLLAAFGKVQIVVIRLASIPGEQDGTAIAIGYPPAALL